MPGAQTATAHVLAPPAVNTALHPAALRSSSEGLQGAGAGSQAAQAAGTPPPAVHSAQSNGPCHPPLQPPLAHACGVAAQANGQEGGNQGLPGCSPMSALSVLLGSPTLARLSATPGGLAKASTNISLFSGQPGVQPGSNARVPLGSSLGGNGGLNGTWPPQPVGARCQGPMAGATCAPGLGQGSLSEGALGVLKN